MTALAHRWFARQRRTVKRTNVEGWRQKVARLESSCHPKQRAFVLDGAQRIAALTAGRAGKSTGGRARFVRRMLMTPGADCLFVAVTRAQAEELMWEPLKALNQELGVSARYNETRLRCTFPNNSKLKLVGADKKHDIEKLRGIPRHEVGIDEAASHDAQTLEWLIDRVIGPRLADYSGTLWMVGTPGHNLVGLFYDVTRPGSDGLGFSVHGWHVLDGAPHIPVMANVWREALKEKERKGWEDDNPVWMREYLGLWAADDTENVFRYRPHVTARMLANWAAADKKHSHCEGDPWNEWDPPRDRRTGLAVLPPGEWEYVYGHDMGHSDPYTLEVFAFDRSRRDKTLYHVYEFADTGMYAKRIAELLLGPALDAQRPDGVLGATGWPTGNVADMAALGGALLEDLRVVYGISIAPAEKRNKHDAIELFNGDLVDGRIKVLRDSELAAQLAGLQWDVDKYGNLQENKGQPNHATDAAIYARREAMHLLGIDETPRRETESVRQRFDRATDVPEEPVDDDGLGGLAVGSILGEETWL